LFTLGGGLGAALGAAAVFCGLHLDVRIAALVGMAAMFAGASRALLASVVFAFETTRQPIGLLPLLGGCTSAFLIASLMMKNSIMTEKIERRGVRVQGEYTADYLHQVGVWTLLGRPLITLRAKDSVGDARAWMNARADGSSHQGFPVVDGDGKLAGVLTRRDVFADDVPERTLGELVKRAPVVVYDDVSLREVADTMARASVGRVPIVRRAAPGVAVGIVTRSDLIGAHTRRLAESVRVAPRVRIPVPVPLKRFRRSG
jgi:CBS domain-containing protein